MTANGFEFRFRATVPTPLGIADYQLARLPNDHPKYAILPQRRQLPSAPMPTPKVLVFFPPLVHSPSIHPDHEPIEKNTRALDDVAYQRMIVRDAATPFLFQRTEKHTCLPRHGLDCSLDHSIALARSNGRKLDNVPPAAFRYFQTPHILNGRRRGWPLGRSPRPYPREDTRLHAIFGVR